MAATLWTKNGKLVINGSGNLVLCEICPCLGDDHESPCNPDAPVPGTLTLTLNFAGFTEEVSLVWIEESESCGDLEGWEYVGGVVEICEGLSLQANGVALCCDGDTWNLELALLVDDIQQQYSTGTSLEELTIVDQSPVHYTTETVSTLVACGEDEILFIDIATPP